MLYTDCQCFPNQEKRSGLPSDLEESGAFIVYIQDTHSTENDTA